MIDISTHPAAPFALGIVLAWLAGVRVYLTIFGVGLAGYLGWMDLPESIALAKSPVVLGVCGALALVEFLTDKLPGVDSVWDLVHTLVRIPAGAFLGGIALPTDGGEASVTGMVLGGTVAALSHGLKSGTRALINTSPEPASNWTASIAEDGLVLAALALAVAHPLWALALLVVATIAFIVSIVLLYRLARHVARRVRAAVA
ncbi:MAG: DUF4126 domain-containing protein [Rhodanobacteraceae bacterium]|nr:DUF4126 domain-containing protein [Rhodanobacteraceae bacterium]MBL0039538.1 DUF4126 domain-containing protein [Xanthomonadales bacterium]MBP7622955.1 DUF4126 domain-containing protein [Xanthomonadales bacterium]